MMDMREKIARALLEHGLGKGSWDYAVGSTRDAYFGAADVALAAVFEPTDAMKAAGLECFNDGREPDEIYRTMIHTAKQ